MELQLCRDAGWVRRALGDPNPRGNFRALCAHMATTLLTRGLTPSAHHLLVLGMGLLRVLGS